MGLSEDPGELGGWGPVIADTARKVAANQPRARWTISVRDRTGRLIHHGPAPRHPTAADDAFVRARDHTCRAPGCRAPATHTDLDHTIDWADGGPSTPDNLAALCRHDHRLKHEGGWRIRQLQPGVFHWTTSLGHQYITTPETPLQT